ncbi:hypothetical protein HRV97_03205 [Sphingomonas sp. HHU CXW]|uniref:Secreted protein n=1 Tax=Sphingomonas hominis TaxID=2741495 RepID=A0ABX2JI91_9SPHN|nr:hypothetical protein [Sphingomonas hominis]NTS64169.1 hypothetical protein [Sphingomonas hominis]
MKSYKNVALAALGAAAALLTTATPSIAQQRWCENKPLYDDDRDVGCGYEGEDPTFKAIIAGEDADQETRTDSAAVAAEPQA